ncbi:unnamed protein product [Amoebophrya sp. A25]|nr:unnamed protein product [Amoebophrya sp. A25]|eukprot:GSA25T00025575001.1
MATSRILGMVQKMDLVGLVMQALNVATLMGSIGLKAPQIFRIWKLRSVTGIAETMVITEALNSGLSTTYAFLKGFPFGTWGESAFIWVQTLMQVGLFWKFSPKLDLFPRYLAGIIYVLTFVVVLNHGHILLDDFVIDTIGLIPSGLGTASKIPQIWRNYSQGHTGTLSLITWMLAWAGCVVRVATTVYFLKGDAVTLVGHASAVFLNAILIAQILIYWKKTNAVLEKEAGKKDE